MQPDSHTSLVSAACQSSRLILPDSYVSETSVAGASGSQFGVGLCPICSPLSAAAVRARFDAIASYGERVHEIDLWAANYGSATDKLGVDWAPYWPLLARWLAGNTTTAASGY